MLCGRRHGWLPTRKMLRSGGLSCVVSPRCSSGSAGMSMSKAGDQAPFLTGFRCCASLHGTAPLPVERNFSRCRRFLRLSGLPWVSSSEPVRLRRFHVAAPAWSCHVLLLMALCVGTLGKTLSCIPSCKGMSTSDLAKLAAAQPPSSSQTFDHSVLFSSGWMQPGWRPTLPTPGPATEVEANESARSLVRKTGRRWKTQQTNVNNM